jgi:hypothetical protein
MSKRWVALALVALLAASVLPAQEAGVFAPFPSRLRVAVRDPDVRLTWRDAGADVTAYRIYRHTEEITPDTFADASLIATVPAGTETYVDRPQPGTYHYAVLAENDAGSVFRVLIPFRNRTTEPVEITEVIEPEEVRTEVTSVAASRSADGVQVSFEASPEDRTLVLYRSAAPLDSMDALADATRVAEVSPGDTPLLDYPVPGISYFYGVFPAEALAEGEPTFEPGVTVTADAVEIPLTTTRVTLPPFEGGPRSRNPLPFLRITRELDGGEAQLPQNPVSVRPAVALEDETTAAVSRITENLPEPRVEPLEPRVLPVDRSTTEKGPAAALSTIATGAFAEGRYSEAERLLENLLSISLPDDVAARSHFYLAQTYYFTGRPRPAFLEFMLAREGYYLETRPFVDRILSEL